MEEDLKEYEQLKQKLKSALKDRKQYQDDIVSLEQQIYDKETEYFSNVSPETGHQLSNSLLTTQGNIIKGFDGFSKTSHHQTSHSSSSNINNIYNSSNSNGNGATVVVDPLNTGLPNKDRIFSLSDSEFVNQLKQDGLLPGFEETNAIDNKS
ncbi:similar to Saccharomyces cerevisiae YJR082C EAF6 Subunit of the NuA4 acetyltransferase complex that acetylates histone H4 and NuA3 acetyltransferase complex that acetylates histone H3 [Maudiozyma saulgeensis]|uniref:Chromatin modification-related protein EAF6 n=1 Tax=Maudiozyma saulgeensis TaxID=1789683 RepID=A0A1X7R6K7_9SACH|nr:similar to Saccharomyces cerevisiae YJR082C EAF6 Subunit of the NuA4 acetyltransferase complex that acetylates histone H4 and NuA3 acetyltransferase complex that acetylates histone H3 [Kazachstania saulgeensis]